MAEFKIAEKITGGNEGGYANNPADRGGETYAGIARKHWPNWKGWAYIDKYKAQYLAQRNFKLSLAAWVNRSAKVQGQPVNDFVSQFYKQNFWNVNHLDFINDQQLANTVYDFGVNSGTGRAADKLQDAYNDIRPKGAPVLKNDSDIGAKTLAAVNAISAEKLHTRYNQLRKQYYEDIAVGDQAQFLKGWLIRLKKYEA